MRTHLFLCFVAVLAVSCAPTGQVSNNNSGNAYYAQFRDLASALKQHPAVSVTGNGSHAQVAVRRFATSGQNDPLFILNDTPIGQSYNRAHAVVNMSDVYSIKVLNSPSQLIPYGQRAAHGAIIIKTRDQNLQANNEFDQEKSRGIVVN